MAVRKLTATDGGTSAQFVPPKDELERLGLVDDDGEVIEGYVEIRRVGEAEFQLEFFDEDMNKLSVRDSRTAADGGERR
jgi:hypothetical protein